MNYVGNIPEQNVIHTTMDRYDYVSPENPTIDVDPSTLYTTWLNVSTGELFVCRSNEVGLNMWIGQLGTTIGQLPLEGLVYSMGAIEGEIVTDLSGEGHLADITGNLIEADNGIEFDGASFLSFSDLYEMHEYTKDFTIGGSFTLSEILDYVGIVSKVESSSTKQFSLITSPDGSAKFDYEIGSNNFSVDIPSSVVNVGERAYFILSVSYGVVAKLEVNGVVVESLAPTETEVGPDLLQIGRRGGTYLDSYFTGILHSLNIYSKELVGVEKSNLAWVLMNL